MDGIELKIQRIRAGLTLWQLGQLAGIHPARISEMERSQRVIADSVIKVLHGELTMGGLERVE